MSRFTVVGEGSNVVENDFGCDGFTCTGIAQDKNGLVREGLGVKGAHHGAEGCFFYVKHMRGQFAVVVQVAMHHLVAVQSGQVLEGIQRQQYWACVGVDRIGRVLLFESCHNSRLM